MMIAPPAPAVAPDAVPPFTANTRIGAIGWDFQRGGDDEGRSFVHPLFTSAAPTRLMSYQDPYPVLVKLAKQEALDRGGVLAVLQSADGAAWVSPVTWGAPPQARPARLRDIDSMVSSRTWKPYIRDEHMVALVDARGAIDTRTWPTTMATR